MKTTLLILASVLCASSSFSQDAVPATPAAIENWRDARFGMFIHWGPVSLTGHEIGWSRGKKTPIEEYDNLYRQFNPTKFNADEWVAIANETTFSGITIEEALSSHSSRVRKFELQKKSGDAWQTFHSGGGLGAHFKATFAPVTTSTIRLNILDASEGPTISEISLIQSP